MGRDDDKKYPIGCHLMRYVRILSVETERDVATLDVGDEIGPHVGGYI